jgi:hypothetical protein
MQQKQPQGHTVMEIVVLYTVRPVLKDTSVKQITFYKGQCHFPIN